MEGSRAALRYAKALLELANEKNKAADVNNDMGLISNTIAASEDLRVVIKSPVIKPSGKKGALEKIFSGVDQLSLNLFGVLLENKRINLLPLVASKYTILFNEMNGVQEAKVTTAVPLSPEMEKQIQAKVKNLTGNEAKINNIIDESILGGFILRVGDLQYNASVAHQLKDLKRKFQNNTYVSKI